MLPSSLQHTILLLLPIYLLYMHWRILHALHVFYASGGFTIFSNFSMNDFLSNWEACMGCGSSKERGMVALCIPMMGMLKFNVDGSTRGKPRLAGIRRALCNDKGEILCLFSKSVEARDSTEAKVLALLEALRWVCLFFFVFFFSMWSDSGKCWSNAIYWVIQRGVKHWKFQFYLYEINVVFSHVDRLSNWLAYSLAIQGVLKSSPWEAFLM